MRAIKIMRSSNSCGTNIHYFFIRLLFLLASVTFSANSLADAEIASPSPGSTLSSSTQTFTWNINDADVERVWLYVGTSEGGREIANSGDMGNDTEYDVIGIPVDGSTIHTRLWFYSASGWFYADSSYTAATLDGDVSTPSMLSPANDSNLAGASVEFTWSDNNTPVNFWWLHLGTTQGKNDLYDSGPAIRSRNSVTVDGLPVDGSRVYGRLWYRTAADDWQYTDYTYQTGTPTTATNFFGPESVTKLASGEGGFDRILDGGDRFGRDHDRAGDINGDGTVDLVVGARSDDDGATDAGAVYILFMNADGTVQSHQKISVLEGGFTDSLVENNFFGYGVAGIGDYDGDNIPDIAVSAPNRANQAIYILHLNSDGTVKSMEKTTGINSQGLSAVGDLNGDGRIDLVAPEPNAAGGGAIRLLFFNADSTLNASETVVISSTEGGFGTGLAENDQFGGRESALLGDIDNDGTIELAVGAFQSDEGAGAIWILSLDPETFNVSSKLKIAPGLAGFDEDVSTEENPNGTFGAQFGHAMAAAGDLNGDGIADLVTGANQFNEGYGYILYLNADKTVKSFSRINSSEGGFNLALEPTERFSRSISYVGDNRQNGSITINFGGGAGVSGSIFQLKFDACEFERQPGNNFWSEGTTFFSNWNHAEQVVTDPLNYEECAVKMYEHNGVKMTHQNDGRCVVKDDSAILEASSEGSQAYIRNCP